MTDRDVYLKGTRTAIRLRAKDFKNQGGEGAVYVQGNIAYKLYMDNDGNYTPQKMIPVGKVKELSALDRSEVIKPIDVLLDRAGVPIGFSMQYVDRAVSLVEIFPRNYRDDHGLTPSVMLELVRKLQSLVAYTHSKKILIVDLNEMNFLVDDVFQVIYAIDVDSYETPSYRATAIKEIIRDFHCTDGRWSELTDWFSFGVLSFQMFTGCHPYKGSHPKYGRYDWIQRMKDNVSVFNSQASVPQTALPFSVIPSAYLDWYRNLFERGVRALPPSNPTAAIVLIPTVTKLLGSDQFVFTEVGRFPSDVTRFNPRLFLTRDGLYQLSGRRIADDVRPDAVIGVTPRQGHVVLAWRSGGMVQMYDATAKRDLPLSIAADEIVAAEGRILIRRDGTVSRIEFIESAAEIVPTAKAIGTVHERSSRLFERVAIHTLLGATHANLFPDAGGCYVVRIDELEGYRIVDAATKKNVLVAVGEKDGRYDRFVLRFDDRFGEYDVRKVEGIDFIGINFMVLDKGMALLLNEMDELEIFSAHRGSAQLKTVADPVLGGDCRLFSEGDDKYFVRGATVMRIDVKKP